MTTPFFNPHRLKICIVAALFVWTLWVFFPGSYTLDSWYQYKEMIKGRYDDWYDGGMALAWHMLWKITGHYQSMYIVNMLLYWLFIALLTWRMTIRSVIFWVILALGIFFCFIPQYVMRDTLMALLWGYAALGFMAAGRHERKALVYMSILLLGYGLLVRANTVIAVLPMLWISIALVAAKPPSFWKHLLFSLSACCILFITTRGIIYKVMHATKAYPDYKLKLLDIGGISKLSGADYFPPCISRYSNFNFDTLLANYTPASFDDIYWPPGKGPSIIPLPDASLDSCIDQRWLKTVSRHPIFYFRNRLSGFLYYLRIRKRFKDNEYYNTVIGIEPGNPLHLQQEPNPARERFVSLYHRLDGSFVYSPWFLLLLNLSGFAYFYFLLSPDGRPILANSGLYPIVRCFVYPEPVPCLSG